MARGAGAIDLTTINQEPAAALLELHHGRNCERHDSARPGKERNVGNENTPNPHHNTLILATPFPAPLPRSGVVDVR